MEVVPCVHIPEFGDASAPVVCEQLGIKSQNDKAGRCRLTPVDPGLTPLGLGA